VFSGSACSYECSSRNSSVCVTRVAVSIVLVYIYSMRICQHSGSLDADAVAVAAATVLLLLSAAVFPTVLKLQELSLIISML
jgi:hypothetical protein